MKTYPIQVLFREYFEGILAAVFLALFLRFFVLSVLYIPSDSMEPNLQRGDFVIGWRLSYGFPLPLMKGERLNFKVPARGDIISFRFPGDEEQMIIRRVIGLPGDKVAIKEGILILNDQPVVPSLKSEEIWQERLLAQKESHSIIKANRFNMEEFIVPEGQVFVLSDHRKRGDDSRDWGGVPFNHIESRLGFIWLSVSNQESGVQVRWPRMFSWIK